MEDIVTRTSHETDQETEEEIATETGTGTGLLRGEKIDLETDLRKEEKIDPGSGAETGPETDRGTNLEIVTATGPETAAGTGGGAGLETGIQGETIATRNQNTTAEDPQVTRSMLFMYLNLKLTILLLECN